MNYDEARPLKDGGWHWTTMNDGMVRAAPPCVRFERIAPKNGIDLRTNELVFCSPHANQEEAERHFYEYSLDRLVERTSSSAEKCAAGCGEWTDKALEDPGMSGYFRATWLCDAHRNKEQVAELHPFAPGIQLIHS